MSERQTELARHALGLPNVRSKSYRNRFYCSEASPDYTDWRAMVGSGMASAQKLVASSLTLFRLSHAAAMNVLQDGETLDAEDFPSSRGTASE